MPKFGSYTELTTLADADTVLVKDASAGLTKYITATNFAAYVANETVDLDGISDVAITSLSSGEVLWTSDGSTWVNGTLAEADIAAASRTVTIAVGSASLTTSAGAQDLTANRTWTLDTAQDIQATASPTFVGLTLSADLVTTSTIDGVDIASFKSAYDTHAASDGSDHTFIDQDVTSGSTPTFTATNITGVPAASILAGTFGTGAYTMDSTLTIANSTGGASMLDIRRSSSLKSIRFENYDGTNSSMSITGSENLSAWGTTFIGFGFAARLGNVGIGTGAPDYPLHVVGEIFSSTTVTATTLAGTLSTATQNSVTTMTGLVTVGTIGSGTWQGTAIDSAYIDQTLSVSTLTASGNVQANDVTLSSTVPILRWSETGVAADSGLWKSSANGTTWKLMARNDADSGGTDAVAITRTTTNVDLFAVTADSTTFSGTVSGITTLTATTLNGTLGTAAQPNVTSVGTLTGLTLGGTLSITSGEIVLPATAKFYLDGSAGTGGDTYLKGEGAANQIEVVTGGTVRGLFNASGLTIASDLTLASGSITSASGAIDFGNETLSTTGTGTLGTGIFNGFSAPASGSSTEVLFTSGTGFVQAYDRTGSAYLPMVIRGSTLELWSNGANRYSIDTSGNHDFKSGTITTTGAISGGAGTFTGTTLTTGDGGSNSVINVNATTRGYYKVNGSQSVVMKAGQLCVGPTITDGDGTLHVHTASAGAVTASTTYDDLVVENSASAGISIISPDASTSGIYFASPSETAGGIIQWGYSTLAMSVGTNSWGGTLALKAHTGVTNLTLSGASGSELATFAGDVTISGTGTNRIDGKIDMTNVSYTSGNVFDIRNTGIQATGSVMFVKQDHASSAAAALYIEQDGSGDAVVVATGDASISAGQLNLAAATTARPSLNIPSGTAPTSPTNGDIWSDGSDLLVRLGGTTYTLNKT